MLKTGKGQFTNFTTDDGLADNRVNVVYQDADGTLWFRIAGGFSKYDGERLVNLTTQDGLANNAANAQTRKRANPETGEAQALADAILDNAIAFCGV